MVDSVIQLPMGWEWSTLRNVITTIESGGRPKGGARGITDGIPSLGGEHLLYSGKFNFDEIKYIPENYYRKMTRGKINRFDVLVVKDGATTGKTSFVGEDFPFIEAAVNEHVFILRPNKTLLPKFLFYWFQSPSGQACVADNFRGAAQGGITLGILDNSNLPIAPVPEQERIVNRIEELFSDLEAGVAALERVRAGLRRYKASVLKAAVEGRLLGDRGVESNGELPQGWRWVTVGEIGEISGGLTKNSKRNVLKKKMPYLRVANVYANELHLDDISEIGIEEKEIERALLQDGDLLVVEGNGSADQIGRVAIWNGSISPCLHQNHIIKVRFELKEVAEYVLYWLLSDGGREQITKVASSTSGLYTLSLSKVSNLSIPLPPLTEQRQIVSEVERRLSVVSEVESTMEAGLVRASRLRQAILRSAFEGRLL